MVKDEGPRIPIKEVRKMLVEKAAIASQGATQVVSSDSDIATHNYSLGTLYGLTVIDNFLSDYESYMERNEEL